MKSSKSIISSVCLTQMIIICFILTVSASCFGQVDRETWQSPKQIMDSIGVRQGMRVGEAGAGQGYFTFPLARRVGSGGMVFSNDISGESLDVIRERAVREGLKNIRTVVGEVEDPLFPEKNLDLVRGLPNSDQGDLFISFMLTDGNWTDPVTMGTSINTNQMERFSTVSSDGKYLFFTRDTPGYDEDVYWVSAKIIDDLKKESIKQAK